MNEWYQNIKGYVQNNQIRWRQHALSRMLERNITEETMTNKELCPICGGFFEKGTTTFTVDYKAGVVVVRNVTAFVCDQCGEAWLDDQTAEQLEHIVNKAKKEKNEFQVIQMAA